MRRGGSLIVTILLLFGAFYLGVLYERHDCKIDLPQTAGQVGKSVACRDYRSNINTNVPK